jgi:hypothetical protein
VDGACGAGRTPEVRRLRPAASSPIARLARPSRTPSASQRQLPGAGRTGGQSLQGLGDRRMACRCRRPSTRSRHRPRRSDNRTPPAAFTSAPLPLDHAPATGCRCDAENLAQSAEGARPRSTAATSAAATSATAATTTVLERASGHRLSLRRGRSVRRSSRTGEHHDPEGPPTRQASAPPWTRRRRRTVTRGWDHGYMQANWYPTPDEAGATSGLSATSELIGIELRSFLVLQMLHFGGPVRVHDMVQLMDASGFAVAGRPSKVISDALRWEVARGRVVRLRRGLYRACRAVPRTTLRRMKARVASADARRPAPIRLQPLREHRPLVSPDGPWRYRLRYGLHPPRRPAEDRAVGAETRRLAGPRWRSAGGEREQRHGEHAHRPGP